ncbi:carbamate kinase [Rodentibacter caecimuris]|uniref:carbamate kinase n=1 Tax=Rodentibacter caecimuris TaxID=1796644 RepID=UPI001094230D|nr:MULTISPECIES: carbamate kinase [Pasteurellaceae]MCQ9124486.1 carbamate kinase [Rodentibacter heylii]MCX2960681.1 carbamate kinase [Rodentibacter heylii]QIA77872.1 carbamate kinase [Rodentibacter heylii]TGY50685.1 carbamate kinase [Pasteurella caecimuris]
MRIVVALGGNALLKRGEPMTAQNQSANIRIAAEQLAKIKQENELVISHGNGPQVGLLALQHAAYYAQDTKIEPYPLDVLVSQTVGMIGYMLQQELINLLPQTPTITVLNQVIVDPKDPAFETPSKPIGQVYTKEEAEKLASEKDWTIMVDGQYYRRAVPSPLPKAVTGIDSVKALLANRNIVICGGGGGIPSYYNDQGELQGVEAVVDKDLCSAVISQQLEADLFIIATDVPAAYVNFNKPDQKRIAKVNPQALEMLAAEFAAGSMGPKVKAVINFVNATGKEAVIGSLNDIELIVKGDAGTRVTRSIEGVEFY